MDKTFKASVSGAYEEIGIAKGFMLFGSSEGLYLEFLKNILYNNPLEYQNRFISRMDFLFSNLTVRDLQENLTLSSQISNYAKGVLITDRKFTKKSFDGSDKDLSAMLYIKDLQYFYLIDRLQNLPTTKNSNENLAKYLFGSTVLEVFYHTDNNNNFNDRYLNFFRTINKNMLNQEAIIYYDSRVESAMDVLIHDDDNIEYLKTTLFKKDKNGSLSYKIFTNIGLDSEERTEVISDKNLLNKVYEKNIKSDNSLSEIVYEKIVGNNSELESELIDIKYLTIIADPIYTNNIPFETLRPIRGLPLLYNFEAINYANSISEFNQKKSRRISIGINKALIFGNVDYSGHKNSPETLKWTDTEIDNISNMFFKSSVFEEKNATETNFKSSIKNIDIIHLALHGINVQQDYRQSSLIFANDKINDGLLQFNEISNLNLDHVNLVVLSACDTNKGESFDGFGNISLQRAFKEAGVSNVISTLWSIDDQATYYFMIEYYNALKEHRNSSIALNTSKQNFITKYPQYNSPHYWAAFVHY